MKREMYSIFDSRARLYAAPFPHHNRGTAMRAVGDSLNNPEDPMRRNAADYELHSVGIWDDENGEFEIASGDGFVCKLTDLIPQG